MMRRFTAVALAFVMLTGCTSRDDEDSPSPSSGGSSSIEWMEDREDGGEPDVTPEEPEESGEPELVEEQPLKTLEFTPEQAREILQPEENVVYLGSARELAALAALVNSGDEWYRDYRYEMKNDISLGGIDFIPIGRQVADGTWHSFEAAFSGGDHIISGLTIRENGFENGTGLFGSVGENGSVEAVHLIGAEVTGRSGTGGVVGVLRGRLTGCSIRGEVTGTNDVGGLFGLAYAEGDSITAVVRECASNSIVKGASSVGGLGGTMAMGSTVSDCYALGSATIAPDENYDRQGYLGGLVGFHGSDGMSNCFSVVEVYTRISSDFVGGYIGYNAGPVDSCYYAEYLSTWDGVCFEGIPEITADVTGCTVEEITEQSTFRGWDFGNVWGIDVGRNRGLPYLVRISG